LFRCCYRARVPGAPHCQQGQAKNIVDDSIYGVNSSVLTDHPELAHLVAGQ
jgi:hypothetical protein